MDNNAIRKDDAIEEAR
jgi:hypothetical protein